MAETIQTFDAQSVQRIAATVRRLESQVSNLTKQLETRNRDLPAARIIRTGITAVSEQYPTYPEPPANTFLVQFEDWTWEEKDWEDEQGDLDQSLYAWPKKFVFARTKNGSYLEQDTRVFLYRVATKSGDRWYILDDELTPFELLVDVYSVDGFPVRAKEITPDGSEGNEITVETDPLLGNIYGPAAAGFRGWARRVDDGTDEDDQPKHKYLIVHMQRFARHILFTADFNGGCVASGPTVSAYWDGEDPDTSPFVPTVNVEWMDCQCLETETGIAVLDEYQSSGGSLFYHVVSLDQVLNIKDVDECDEEGYSCIGDPIRTLLIGKGLTLQEGSCDGQTCTKVLQADMLEVVGVDCETNETQKLGVQTLYVDAPLTMTAGDESECLGTARVGLPTDFIASDCLDVEYDDEACQYLVNLPESLVKAGAGIAVAAGACDYTISATGLEEGIEEGTCIEFDVDGDTVTINNTMEIIGGNGVYVEDLGCTKVISLTGDSSPQTTITYLCDVTISQDTISISCVSDGEGGYTFSVTGGEITLTKKYGSLALPSAIVSDQSSDCGGSGSGSGSSGAEYYVTITDTDCNSSPRTVSFKFNSLPTGFDHYEILAIGTTSNEFIESTPACPTYCALDTEYTTNLPTDPDGSYSVSWRLFNSAGDVIHIHSEVIQC